MTMFSIFKHNSEEEQLKRNYLISVRIGEKPEIFYVMDQRQFITHGFLMDKWPLVKDLDIIKKHETITRYVKAIEMFNGSLKAFKDFESWYTADINNKTPEGVANCMP